MSQVFGSVSERSGRRQSARTLGLDRSNHTTGAELFALRSWRADPDTGLPDRGEYERALAQYLAVSNNPASDQPAPISVLLIAPKILSDEHLPALLDQAASRAQRVLRDTDQLYRYTNTALALPLLGVDEDGLKALAQKLLGPLLDSVTVPPICVGPSLQYTLTNTKLRICAPLSAPTRGSHPASLPGRKRRSHLGTNSTQAMVSPKEEPLKGIFTADPVHDYRNMQLLWDAVERLSNLTSAAELAMDIVQLI